MVYKSKIKIILDNDDDIKEGELIEVSCYDIIGDASLVRIKYYSERIYRYRDLDVKDFDRFSTIPMIALNTFFEEVHYDNI